MMNYFNHVCSRLYEFLFKNRKEIVIATVAIVSAIGLFVSGVLYAYYLLSEEPEDSMHFLVYKKCHDDERGMKFFTCMSEEFAHVRTRAFLAEGTFKGTVYIRECEINKVDKAKCLDNLSDIYQERLKKYRELNDLMR
ncbi:TPA: hypothetical protein OW286_002892 [Citrobacter freundii]|nr:hypothetical protein [Citrobacter freundii]